MNQLFSKSNLLFLAISGLSFLSFSQSELPPGPCNFKETETICVTNNSNRLESGSILSAGCDYQVCVKIKPKTNCEINCEMLLDPDGYYIQVCHNLAVGETFCLPLPVVSHPITDCFQVDLTIKVVGHAVTLATNLPTLHTFNGMSYSDDCNNLLQDHTVIKKITGPGDFNIGIFLRRYTGM